MELAQFHKSLERVTDVLASRHREAVKRQVVEVAARRQPVQALGTALVQVERDLGRLHARITSKGKPTRGRTWQPPRRKEPKRIDRDALSLKLQKLGLTFDKAREVVDAIWESIKDALKRGEEVETPLGGFQVVERLAPRMRWRLGKVQHLYRQRKKVVFTATEEIG